MPTPVTATPVTTTPVTTKKKKKKVVPAPKPNSKPVPKSDYQKSHPDHTKKSSFTEPGREKTAEEQQYDSLKVKQFIENLKHSKGIW